MSDQTQDRRQKEIYQNKQQVIDRNKTLNITLEFLGHDKYEATIIRHSRHTKERQLRQRGSSAEAKGKFLRGFWVIIRPNSLKLIQVVSTEDSPVSCQVFKVVHDDGNKQVDDLDGKKSRITFLRSHKLSFQNLYITANKWLKCDQKLNIWSAVIPLFYSSEAIIFWIH